MKWKPFASALMLCALAVTPAHALEFTIGAPSDPFFGKPTSQEAVITQRESDNTDRSKNVALVPPGFGSPTSYLPGSGNCLTPNLVPGALSGGLVNSRTNLDYTTIPTVDTSAVPDVPGSSNVSWTAADGGWTDWTYTAAAQHTDVTSDLYYSNGSLGTLKIPALGVNVKIYEGTDSATLAKGAGHFTGTSIWAGNVCVAGHNRGTNCYFGQIHTLNIGDKIILTTKLGTRTYSVTSVRKISETDSSGTAPTGDNRITLFTCVRNESAYRWCVQAVEV